jgi:hypothetical protein
MFGDMVVKPKLEAACMWTTRWVDNATASQNLYDAFDAQGNMNAIAKAINVWGSGLLKSMVSTISTSSYVKTYASYDATSKKLSIFILNKDNISKQISLKLNNYVASFNGSKWQFKGTSVSDKFPLFQRTDSIYAGSGVASTTVAPNSVMLIKLQAYTPPSSTQPLQILSASPNPFASSITVSIRSDVARKVPVRVIDVNGTFVRYETRNLVAGVNTFTIINLGSLLKGVYMLRIGDAPASSTYTVMKG